MAPLPKLELAEGEQIQHEESAMYLKGKVSAWAGTLMLTDRRLVFLKRKTNLFGLIGALVSSGKGGVLFDLPLGEIRSFERSKHGVNKNVLAMSAGEHEQLRFILGSSYEDWAGRLSTAAPQAQTGAEA